MPHFVLGQATHRFYSKDGFCYRGLGVQGKIIHFSYVIESDNYDQALVVSSLAAQSIERFSLPGFRLALFGIMTVNMFQFLCFHNDLKESERGSKFTSAAAF